MPDAAHRDASITRYDARMSAPATLYNTQTRREEPIAPADPKRVTMYSCGPTVYDDAHIGNFRAFLIADLLRRWIESPLCAVAGVNGDPSPGPRSVIHVMNITDVGHMTDDDAADGGGEDKMALAGERLREAKKAGRVHESAEVDPTDPLAIAGFYAGRFIEDATALGMKVAIESKKDASLMPRATDAVPGMVEAIAKLVERGFAYVRGEEGSGAVYFDVQRLASYGELSGNDLEQLRGGAGGRVDAKNQSQKNHPADFLLWKEDARHLLKWESPWGMGYPGWHIECTVMSLERLVPGGLRRILGQDESGATIDIHTGGEDNIFPHHECERAQTIALTGAPVFARHWLHTRFLMVGGEKMSKSRGTFYTPRQLMADGHEAAAIRLELIKTHYRANADFSLDGLNASAKTVDRWRRFVSLGEASGTKGEPPVSVVDGFKRSMSADLNIAGALGEINAWINATLNPTESDAAALRSMDAVIGVLDLKRAERQETSLGVFIGVAPSDEVETLLQERAGARKAKDYARSDQIRDTLAAMGYAIKDVAGGRVEVSRG